MGTLSVIWLIFLSSKIEKGKKDTDEMCAGGCGRQHTRKKVPAKYGEARIKNNG